MADETKPLVASTTVWMNIIYVGALVLSNSMGIVPVEYTPYAVAALGALNLIWRFFTGKPIEGIVTK